MKKFTRLGKRETGYAALFIGVVVLLILTLTSIYLARSGIIDLRTAANRVRYSEALNDAEMRAEKAIAYLSISGHTTVDWAVDPAVKNCEDMDPPYSKMGEKWADGGTTWLCKAFAGTYLPANYDADTTSVIPDYILATPNVTDKRGVVFAVMAGGKASDVPNDGTTQAVVSQGVFLFAPGGGTPLLPPMMGAGNIPLNGTYNVVANPNGGGNGVPVSIWTKVGMSNPSGSAATCQLAEFNANGDCTATAISSSAGKGPDIKDNDADFPEMFEYLFGVKVEAYEKVKTQSLQLTTCENLNAELAKDDNKSVQRVWVTGNCEIKQDVSRPIILVVETGEIVISANTKFDGVLFAFGPKPNENAGDIKANGGAVVRGSIMSNDKTAMGITINGTFSLIYDSSVMAGLTGGFGTPTPAALRLLTKIPGSWTDFYE